MKYFFIFLLFILFFFSSYRMVGENVTLGAYGAYGAYLTYLVILASFILFKVKRFAYNKILVSLILLFTILTVTSALFNSEIGLVFQSFIFLSLFLSTNVLFSSYFKEKLGKAVAVTLILSHVPLIILPLLTDGIKSFPYKGIFDNSNSYGIVTATIFSVLLSLMLFNIEKTLLYREKPSKLLLIANFIFAVLSFVLVIVSASRTSFLAGVISLLIGSSIMFLFAFRHRLVLKVAIKSVVILPMLVMLYFLINRFIPINLYIQQIIFSKFERKSSDLLDGRSDVWIRAINDARIFGNGENYFANQVGLGAHNTFIYIMGVYGWLPLIVFLLFIIASGVFCVRYVIISKGKYKYLPLLTLTTFLSLSMTENLMFKITMVLTFVLIGLAANNKKIKISI